jgi:predicted transcriptional regulator
MQAECLGKRAHPAEAVANGCGAVRPGGTSSPVDEIAQRRPTALNGPGYVTIRKWRADIRGMLALSIRQPYAELILRGIKTIEYRTRATRIVGERFYIYAAKKKWPGIDGQLAEESAKRIWSDDLAVTGHRRGEHPPSWMMELAEQLILGKLPSGVIVGSAVIERVTRGAAFYEWHLGAVERLARVRKPDGHPQPVWFKPF